MTAHSHTGQEETMTPMKIKISLGLVLAVLVASLALATGAAARVLPEPGPSSPVKAPHVRKPAVKKSKKVSTRKDAGYPNLSGQHVKSQAELRTE
jgi:hypothetical protein